MLRYRQQLTNLKTAISLFNTYAEGQLPRYLVSHQSSSIASAANVDSSNSRILVACVFERLPVVMPAPPAWEAEYQEWRQSATNKFKKTLPKELTDPKKSEQLETGPQWSPAPLETAADKTGDKTSLRRRLDQRIFFLVKNKASTTTGSETGWTFPQTEVQPGETTRQTAERVLSETISLDGVQPYFVGNAPAGHVEQDNNNNNTKLFFHRCQLIQGQPALQSGSGFSSHVWVAKDELKEYIKDAKTLDVLTQML